MITKLPDELDPNTMIYKGIKKQYGSKCPYCGNEHINTMSYNDITWYGRVYEGEPCSIATIINPINWFKPKHHWVVNNYHCSRCGTRWKTPPYPTDIITEKEANEIFKKLINDN